MDDYDIAGACQAVLAYVDALNNWYIRRSRPRFWRTSQDADKQAAYDALGSALEILCRVASPLLPFTTEEIWRGLTGGESVHLADWPDPTALPAAPDLVEDMDRVRDVVSTAFAMRRAESVRVRQPLPALTVAGPGVERLEPFLSILADEVNVKEVRLRREGTDFASFRLQVNARAVGPRLGGETKRVIAASKQGDWRRLDEEHVEVAGQRLGPGEFSLLLEPREGVACQALPGSEMIVVLDTALTEPLVREGKARDLVRLVQQARREAGLHVSDRIRLALQAPADLREAVEDFRDYVAENVLAREILLDGDLDGEAVYEEEVELGGAPVRLALARA
jgi:isoleucyl-tRNA synthetase